MLLTLFYEIDNFCKAFVRFWQKFLLKQGLAKRIKPCSLCLSEIMTIVVNFHMSGFRTFKDYYIKDVCQNLRKNSIKKTVSDLNKLKRLKQLKNNLIESILWVLKRWSGSFFFANSQFRQRCLNCDHTCCRIKGEGI